jgi:apolipoprotein N-acyltransferase
VWVDEEVWVEVVWVVVVWVEVEWVEIIVVTCFKHSKLD